MLAVFLPKPAICQALLVLGTLVQIVPHSTYWVGVHAGRYGNPIVGPLVTHVLVLAPVAFLSASLVMHINVSGLPQLPDSQDRTVRHSSRT